MQTIVFNMSTSVFTKSTEATALKVGYLLSNEVFSAGDTPLQINYREQMSRYSMPERAGYLSYYFRENPEQSDTFKKLETSLRQSCSFGHRITAHLLTVIYL